MPDQPDTDKPQKADCHPRIVRLLPCPFCGSEAVISDQSLPDRPESWFFAWCCRRPDCSCWLADGSPEAVAEKWNRRAERIQEIEEWREIAEAYEKALRRIATDFDKLNGGECDRHCGKCIKCIAADALSKSNAWAVEPPPQMPDSKRDVPGG